MTTVNVNLRPCPCPRLHGRTREDLIHGPEGCPAAPIMLLCPIPRSVPMTVRLGECTAGCESPGAVRALKERGEIHHAWCPARPIRVACSIGGEMWADSFVEDVEPIGPMESIPVPSHLCASMDAACRARWEIVKALVTGSLRPESGGTLVSQRDSVFSALVDMAKAESTIIQRMADIDKVHTNRTREAFRGVAADELAAYVSRLIEQVGAL